MKLLYKFIGTEADKKKFVDPEPEAGTEYSMELIDLIVEKNPFNIWPFFEGFEVPEEPINHITPMMRLEIAKAFSYWFGNLKEVENYINTGSK